VGSNLRLTVLAIEEKSLRYVCALVVMFHLSIDGL
jgi:hypothetical protein